ncbi:double C2-like domain-containing protein alpha [Phocoena sinus]|uniref:double C2-like domain-containing protein alpha n=1 Tax=Phocoena sinus TaxID=42100 RepID=UPI0013C4D098|nr:double C2-like domain-containing protein alpha [Phocoena sinus]
MESAEYKRRTKYVQKSLNPEWNQTVIYKNISMEQLKKKTLEVTVWDYDRFSSNDFLGETCRFPPLRNPIVVPVARNPHPKAISALMDHLAVKAKPASLRPTWKMQGLL